MPRIAPLLAFAAGIALTLAIQSIWPLGQAEAGKPGLNREGFDRALDTVLDRHVDPVDQSRVLTSALKHLVHGLDDYSHYLTAAERKTLSKRGHGGATGMSIHYHRGEPGRAARVEITAVLPDSPAARVGLSPGDQILRIGESEVGWLLSQAEAEGLLVGAAGESLQLVVQRRADPSPTAQVLVLSPATALQIVEAKLIEREGHKHAHIAIRAFRSGVGDQVKRSLAELRRAAGANGLAGIILDLRANPGGDVSEAVAIADLFVSEGVLVRTRGRGGQILREEVAHKAGTDETTHLVVVLDRHSASASELLAVALQDHGRATIIGERSFGKGTVQDVMGMPDGAVLTLTIARYFSPKDRVIDGHGVEPDILIGLPDAIASRELPEAALDAALRGLARAPQGARAG